jgi:hypothetical protein
MKLLLVTIILVFLSILYIIFRRRENLRKDKCGNYSSPKLTERKPYKIVSSFTTTPTRINKTSSTLYSLRKQTYPLDSMLINIPKLFGKNNEPYVIPDFIKNDKSVITNILDKDYGPATKLVGAIISIPKDEDVWIVVHDDDQLYLENTIEEYTKYIDKDNINKKKAYTLSGQVNFYNDNKKILKNVSNYIKNAYINLKDNHKVDILEGFLTYCIHRSVFEDDFISYIEKVNQNKDAFASDDFTISNYLAMKNIDILLINNKRISKYKWYDNNCLLDYGLEKDSLRNQNNKSSLIKSGNFNKYRNTLKYLVENNMYYM